jgi:hypothetical protein
MVDDKHSLSIVLGFRRTDIHSHSCYMQYPNHQQSYGISPSLALPHILNSNNNSTGHQGQDNSLTSNNLNNGNRNYYIPNAGPSLPQPAYLPPSSSTSSLRTTLPLAPDGSRPARSRKNRPCDRCRRAKTRCSIGAEGPPCSQCAETRRSCTFADKPPERKPRAPRNEHEDYDEQSSTSAAGAKNEHGRSASPRRRSEYGGGAYEDDEDEDNHVGTTGRHSTLSPSTSRNDGGAKLASLPNPASNKKRKITRPLEAPVSVVPSFDHLTHSNFDPQGELCRPLSSGWLLLTYKC